MSEHDSSCTGNVTVTIDDVPLEVKKGTNIIEAAHLAGVTIPHFCYCKYLSIAGNCRMCQVEVEGRPKLEISCNMTAQEGLRIRTHATSQRVRDAQVAILEFILINHPMDCTVCDQAGQCKLQDYYYKYSCRNGEFSETKVKKVKASPLGPNVILDGERCIMCTRCIRFLDEITKTSELGMMNRGDKSVISTFPGRELDNPLSGTVVDLCPVGALTHRKWRFKSRIWFSNEISTICTGCSTGCNIQVAVRDSEVLQVKARSNPAVNKMWLCDEGRYGLEDSVAAAQNRIRAPQVYGKEVTWTEALTHCAPLKGSELLVLVAPDLILEEYTLIKDFLALIAPEAAIGVTYVSRELSAVESLLISPDRSPNWRGAKFAGLIGDNIEEQYYNALDWIIKGQCVVLLMIGDGVIPPDLLSQELLGAVTRIPLSIGLFSDKNLLLSRAAKVVFPTSKVFEKSGLMINSKGRLQYLQPLMSPPAGAGAVWQILNWLGKQFGNEIVDVENDEALTERYLSTVSNFSGLSIEQIVSNGGVSVDGINCI